MSLDSVDYESFRQSKEAGFSDRQLADYWSCKPSEVRAKREELGISTTYRLVDTCAAEFEAYTPYYYSSYGDENEMQSSDKKKIMILGVVPTVLGRELNLITVVFMHPLLLRRPDLKRSWLIPILRLSPPIMMFRTVFILSPSLLRMYWRFTVRKNVMERSFSTVVRHL